ncbi:aromatic acid/H+ symport family MFS transporter [Klugiella xanthotipulae]|uniref:Sugar phosphate permease n=1 Tax=Klugiella xanthotipulae TaxID=244735 RepID=A0A543HT90_9MICO|nr:aromatic acid/H+ symport family MFS transporter [Klugiella xanthotipulae]TQM61565.1 sugar phosphate permease [Klugiella xanthotipulae]
MEKKPQTLFGISWPVLLCWITIALDGFDLVVLGTVIPTLVETGDIGFDGPSATFVSTIGLVGVGMGAVLIGPLADNFGRRRALIACVALFSVCTFGIALAPSVMVFGILRFLAGLGLGACLPTVLAYMSEFTPAHRTGRGTTTTMTGYHVGAVLTALLALIIIPDWRMMFVIGGVAGILVLPFIWAKLPESESFTTAQSIAQSDGTKIVAASTPTDLVRKPYLFISLGIWAASFMGLLLVYGLNTWLPQLMREAGYELGDSLAFLLVLNVGAVVGLLLAGVVADRRGLKTVTLTWFFLAAIFLAALSIRMDSMVILYLAVFITGVFVFSAQVLIYAYVSKLYPVRVRGTALGFAAGVGRAGAICGPFITGTLVSAGIAYPWGFYLFAGAALLAVVALLFLPRKSPAVIEAEAREAAETEATITA